MGKDSAKQERLCRATARRIHELVSESRAGDRELRFEVSNLAAHSHWHLGQCQVEAGVFPVLAHIAESLPGLSASMSLRTLPPALLTCRFPKNGVASKRIEREWCRSRVHASNLITTSSTETSKNMDLQQSFKNVPRTGACARIDKQQCWSCSCSSHWECLSCHADMSLTYP